MESMRWMEWTSGAELFVRSAGVLLVNIRTKSEELLDALIGSLQYEVRYLSLVDQAIGNVRADPSSRSWC
jgi:hypothetical protein